MKATDFVKQVQAKEVDIVEHMEKVLDETEKINNEYNYLNSFDREFALAQAKEIADNPELQKGRLAGVAVTIKDAICCNGLEVRGGSRILNGYKPVYDAGIVERIKKQGGIIIGTTAQDEFGFGAFSVNVGLDFKTPLNPFDKEYATGGSSGGAAGMAKKAGFPHISIGESTGGSIASPGSLCGVPALCPTYGRVSRWGLLDYGNSLDKIGPMAQSAEDIAVMMKTIAGHDARDSTSLKDAVPNYTDFLNKDVKGLKIGVNKDGFGENIDTDVKDACWDQIKALEANGAEYGEVQTPLTNKYGVSAYYMMSTSEASTNLSKYCGMRYGNNDKLEGSFNEYFSKVRSRDFGAEVKRRIILGTFARMSGYRDAYYLKAAKVRTMMINEYKEHFKKYDVLVSPTVPFLPPRFDEIEKMTPLQHYLADILLVGPNLVGMPHMNIPVGLKKNLPVGMLGIANHLGEEKLIQLASATEVEK